MGGVELEAIEYVKSVPRYLLTRYGGRLRSGVCTSGLGCIRLAEVDPPSLPGPEWVRLHPLLSGICGSDLATITAQGSPYFSPVISTPFVMGHEIVGVVGEVGPGAERVRSGDRVVLAPPLPCRVRGIDPACRSCREGREPQCEAIDGGSLAAGIQTGFCRDTGGGWSRELVAHQRQLFAVSPDGNELEQVLAEPLSCSLKAAEAATPRDDDTAVIIGCGTIGLLLIAALRALGSGCRIVALGRHPHQEEAARRLGADIVLRGKRLWDELAETLQARLLQPELGPPVLIGGADHCFDCVGSGATLDQSFRLTRAGGRVSVVGMPAVPKGVDWTPMWHKDLEVAGSYTSDLETFGRAVDMIEHRQVRLEGLLGAIYPLSEYRAAIDAALHTGRSGAVKTAFRLQTAQAVSS